MAESTGNLKQSFGAYCQLTNKGSDKGNSMTIKKMCADAKVTGSKLNQNSVDIEYRKCFGNAKGNFDYEDFVNFVDNYLSKIYADAHKISHEEGLNQVRQMLSNAKPQLAHATKPVSTAVTNRLTDVKNYTGSHKQRFDEETGKGLGKAGREDLPDERAAEGYVTGYKHKDSYSKK